MVTAVDFDASGRIVSVEGAQVDDSGSLAEPIDEVPVEQIVFALERGDEVRAKLTNDADARSGPRVRIKEGALREIELEGASAGVTLEDMPRIARTR